MAMRQWMELDEEIPVEVCVGRLGMGDGNNKKHDQGNKVCCKVIRTE
jgi:hypothetical protein